MLIAALTIVCFTTTALWLVLESARRPGPAAAARAAPRPAGGEPDRRVVAGQRPAAASCSVTAGTCASSTFTRATVNSLLVAIEAGHFIQSVLGVHRGSVVEHIDKGVSGAKDRRPALDTLVTGCQAAQVRCACLLGGATVSVGTSVT